MEISQEALVCLIFLLALNGMSLTDIAKKFGMTKNEVHEIVQHKLEEHHAGNENIKNFERFPTWRHSIMEEELRTLWEML